MSKYELSMSASYVPDWGKPEAVREIIQNALDEEIREPANRMYISYTPDENRLIVGNHNAVLDINTLLFGKTTKRDDSKFIGQHGEGYKVAMTVLLREGCTFEVFNHSCNEVWSTRLIKSRKYNGELVPVVETRKENLFQRKHGANLQIEIVGITSDDYQKIVNNTLQLQGCYECHNTEDGELLIDEEHLQKVYIKGLYVCTNKRLKFGYNFEPSILKLDRDRRLVDDFNLQWATSKIMAKVADDRFVQDNMDEFDSAYVKYYTNKSLNDSVAMDFFAKYGYDAVPVYNQIDYDKALMQGLRPVMMSESRYGVLVSSGYYSENSVKPDTFDVMEAIRDWRDKVVDKTIKEELLSAEDLTELDNIISELEDRL